jgi:hypothetical protein
MAKQGDGWLRREMGVAKERGGWLRREMGS